MNENVFQPVQQLSKASRIFPGGLCKCLFTPRENVDTWPLINPQSGGVDDEIILKAGTVLYNLELNPQGRTFNERTRRTSAGRPHEFELNGTLPGNVAENILTLNTMLFHEFLIIFQELDGMYRYLGTEDSGPTLDYDYTSGNNSKSRNRDVKFIWSHANAAPVYLGALSQIPIEIAAGGSFMFIERFKVKAGQPIEPNGSSYSNDLIEGKKVFVLLAEQKILSGSVNDMDGDRYIDKELLSNTFTLKDSNGDPVPIPENTNVEIYAHD